MKRGSQLRRLTPLTRKKPLRARISDSNELRKAKKIVKARARDRCEARLPDVCTYWGRDTHHVLLRSRGGKHDPDGLLYLCRPCHRHIHANPRWATEHGLMRHSWEAT